MRSINQRQGVYRLWAIVAAVQCAACAVSPEELGTSGISMDDEGRKALSGPQGMNGTTLNGIGLNGVQLDGVLLHGFEVMGGQLMGSRGDTGGVLSGEELEGTMWQGRLSDGSTFPLRIEAVDATNDPEILSYTVRYWDGSSWRSLCGEADGAPIQAMALRGRWDLSSGTATGGDFIDDPYLFTFACHGAALAKCVGLGYKPWRTVTECAGTTCREVPLRALHQACTRMMRADYCGDGTPHTRNGVPVNVWDSLSLQTRWDTQGPWLQDAEWSPEGAMCIEHLRYAPEETTAYINTHCPERWMASFSCFGSGSTFFPENGQDMPLAGRSLIRNEFNRPATTH